LGAARPPRAPLTILKNLYQRCEPSEPLREAQLSRASERPETGGGINRKGGGKKELPPQRQEVNIQKKGSEGVCPDYNHKSKIP